MQSYVTTPAFKQFAENKNEYVRESGKYYIIKANQEGTKFYVASKKKKKGSGSFGEVFEIEQEIEVSKNKISIKNIVGKWVAKFINSDAQVSVKEAIITNQFYQTECLVPVSKSRHCMVMEQIQGLPLSNVKLNFTEIMRVAEDLAGMLFRMNVKFTTQSRFTSTENNEILSQLIPGQSSVLHKDICPQNILYSPKYGARIIDFGVSAASRAEYAKFGSGHEGYMAPEVHQDAMTPLSDIYSTGLVLAELVGGESGFGFVNLSNCYSYLCQIKPVFLKDADLADIPPFLKSMVETHPTKRPSPASFLKFFHTLREYFQEKENMYISELNNSMNKIIEKFSKVPTTMSISQYNFFKSRLSDAQKQLRQEAHQTVITLLSDNNIDIKKRISFAVRFLNEDVFTVHQRGENNQRIPSSFEFIAKMIIKIIKENKSIDVDYAKEIVKFVNDLSYNKYQKTISSTSVASVDEAKIRTRKF